MCNRVHLLQESMDGIWNFIIDKKLLQGYKQGSGNGKFSKLTVETRVLPTLNQNLGINKSFKEYKNRLKILKNKYNGLSDHFRFSSGFGWDPETKKFTAPDEVWADYLKAHPGKTNLRDDSFEDFGDLRMIFESNTATGRNAVGLSDAIDTNTYDVREHEGTTNSSHDQIMEDEEIAYEETSVQEVFSALETRRGGKLPPRKKARTETDALNTNKAVDELNTVQDSVQQIFGMIQKRWEKENEEKEAEDKANNVWDAIKEIPDLDDGLCYEAMTLVHSLGMKYGFVHMSIEDRKG
ncbi:PREDICTED: uncharacterized protein At2g29880-like, partial [Camelina sativa]|uniref:Uncharacterized protein At2g29880-like n=1 Tax=Camelina sativa TaxID=90675 RepID=A0ABM0X0E5_CAMSA